MRRLDPRYAWLRQLAAFAVVLAVWEAAGRAGMPYPNSVEFEDEMLVMFWLSTYT